jgi:hypothetical protein
MPLLVTFRDWPVKRRRRVSGELLISLFGTVPGEPGGTVVVSQEEWLRHGKVQFLPKEQMPDVRALVKELES